MTTLNDLTKRLSEIQYVLDGLSDEPDDEDIKKIIEEYLAATGEEVKAKIDRCVGYVRAQETLANYRKAESARFLERAKIAENRAEWMLQRLKIFFKSHDMKSVETGRYLVTLAKNGGVQPIKLLKPVIEIPSLYTKETTTTTTTVDMDAIRKALTDGRLLDFAQLEERGENIRIK